MKKDEQRIIDDIDLIEGVIKEIEVKNKETERIIDLAKRYTQDTSFFLEKKDMVTAFGSINYAHGLLDALRIQQGKI
ncbi:DUF357 domain-containing protein [Candidatus Micrarchaeota archaeon]|nr:DUF357 domain-containing protein [Candidatus Micrarchaeota archaeon]